MIIYSGVITLDYNPATDVLVTFMPSITELSLTEAETCLDIIVTHIRNYDIKKLLLDSSKSVVEVEDTGYKTLTMKFSQNLATTRLQKLARVATSNHKREVKSAQITEELREKVNLPIDFRNFSTYTEAMEWLIQK